MTVGNGPDDFHGSDFEDEVDQGFGTTGTEGLLLPPWERRERYGFLNGLYLTIKDVLLTPRTFFHRMPTRVGLAQPLYFALVLGVVAAFFGWMWSLAGSSLQMFVAEDFEEVFKGPLFSFLAFLFSPITVAILVFIKAGLIHLMLMLVGGNKLGFEATFRVAAYGEAASILALVPFCGGVLGVLWSLFVTIVGLYSIHETDPWRAVAAVIAPMALCLSLISASAILVMVGLS
ncbi:MAG: YIP1 family protein [Candidatus Krumholzibacteriota bacterium]